MNLSVVIVNYKVRDYVLQCLDSLYRAMASLPGWETEVFVVDNASDDGIESALQQYFPQVKFIGNTENKGFGVANNQAIEQCSGEWLFLLNPDVVLPEDALQEAFRYIETLPKVGAVGFRLINGEGRYLPESKRNRPSLLSALGKLTGLGEKFPDTVLNHYYNHRLPEWEVGATDVLAGSAMLLHRQMLGGAARFDEDFFMYGEDIDLSIRILEAGFHNYYLPITLLHYKGESTDKRSVSYKRHFYESMRIYYRKHAQWGYALVSLAVPLFRLRYALANHQMLSPALDTRQVEELETTEHSYTDILQRIEGNQGRFRLLIKHPELGGIELG